ncbi:MAG: hypothetical protein ABSE15_11710 [Candidatus Bathyarchaeia archaeon]|jgi:hypothetical protein
MENENVKVTGIYSKFWRITLVVFSMLLIFAGGTYVPLLLAKRLGYFTSIGAGLVLFIVGFGLMVFLIRKKLITV